MCIMDLTESDYMMVNEMGRESGDEKRHRYQCSKWAGICRYTILEFIFVPEFHTGTYQHILYPLIFSVF
jgi:hypothetical protein